MAQFDDDAPPAGYRYVYSGDPSGGGVRYLEPIADRSIPQATPEGELIPTPPSENQLRLEQERQTGQQSLADFLMNYPTELRDQALAAKELAVTLFGGLVSPVAAGAAALGKNVYDYFDKGQIDSKATKDFANEAARLFSYRPVMPSAQSALETMSEAPEYFLGTSQGLPPVVSGINPRALQTAPVLGPLSAGVKRDVSQFSNDVYNAQRGITPGYATLGSEFSDAFVTPRPTTYELLAGLEPSRIPSTASAAVKPVGKGNTAYSLGEPFPSLQNPSGMSTYMAGRYLRTTKMPDDGLTTTRFANSYKDEVQKVKPEFDLANEMAAYRESLDRQSAVEFLELGLLDKFKQFIDDWNTKNPDDKLPTIEQFVQSSIAANEWMQGPGKTYMERQMGTGAKHDPVLGELEKSNVDPFYDYSRDYSPYADVARGKAIAAHNLNPSFNLADTDIGRQTATTRAGKIYENMSDALINPIPVSILQEANAGDSRRAIIADVHGALRQLAPDKIEQLNKMPPHEVVYDLDLNASVSPVDMLHDKLVAELLAGRIKPENISNVSAQRLMQMIIKDEQGRLKKEQGNKKLYADYKQKFFDNVPESMVDKVTDSGAKFIRFDKDTPLSREDVIRGLCIDTKDLNHCIASGGHNVGDYKGYAPLVEPHTGKRTKGVPATTTTTGYIDNMYKDGISYVTYRGPDGTPIATIQENPMADGKVHVTQIMSTDDEEIKDPAHAKEVRQWLNDNADRISKVGVTAGLSHVGNPFDLYSKNAAESITTKHQNIDPKAFTKLLEMAVYDRTMSLDYDFAEWFKKNTGESIDTIVQGEPFSNIVESGGMGTDDLFERVKERLGPALVESPEFIKFVKDNADIAARFYEPAASKNQTIDLARAIGRFSTHKDIQDYAKSVGIDLSYPQIDIATASKDDLIKYGERLSKEVRAMVSSDSSPDDINAVRQRFDDVAARLNEIHAQEVKKIQEATKDIIETVPNDIAARLDSIGRTPAAWQRLLKDTVDALRVKNVLGLESSDALFADYSGPLRDQIEILYGPVESDVLNNTQSNAIVVSLVQDKVGRVMMMLEEATGPFDPSNGATPRQAAQAAQIMANWAKYRLENPEMTNYGQQPRTEIVEQPNVDRQLRAPEMSGAFANYLRDVWRSYDQSGYRAATAGVQDDFQVIVRALLGNQDPQALLPSDAHWDIVRRLADPGGTTAANIDDLRQSIIDGYGEFGRLTLYQLSNAIGIVDDWKRITQYANPNMSWDRADALRNFWLDYQLNRVMNIDAVPEDMYRLISTLLGNQAENAVLPREIGWHIVRTLANPETTVNAIQTMFESIRDRRGVFGPLMPGQRENAMNIVDEWVNANRIDLTPRDAAVNPLPAIPNMNRERAAALNLIIDEFLNTRVLQNVPREMEDSVNALVGNQAPAAGLPQAAHRHIVALLVHPNTTIPDIRNLYTETMAQGPGLFQGLDEYQRANARAIIEDWSLINGIDIIDLDRNMAAGGRVRRMADGGAVTDTLDKLVKNPQAATMLNLDLPNLVASRQQTKTLRRGGRVQFAHDLDQMRYEMTHRRG